MATYDKNDVKNCIEYEDVYNLLEYLQAEPQDHGDHIICKTICHEGESHKLYYYDEQKLFHCYTGSCGSFDIFELIIRVEHISLNDAINFIISFFNLSIVSQEYRKDNPDWQYLIHYDELRELEEESPSKVEIPVLPEYDNIIQYFPHPTFELWEKEGINKESCEFMNIRFDPVNFNILIPHYDINNRLIGIRQRALTKEAEQFGKYRPWYWHNKLYNHPLAFNLYGLNIAKENIKTMKMAVLVEGKKSVLKYCSYYGKNNSVCVAVCGSSFTKYQFKLLQDLGVQEIVVGFDKDFQEIGSQEFLNVKEKLIKIWNKYKNDVNISFLFDKYGLLEEKDSPLDQGADAFKYLFENRIFL